MKTKQLSGGDSPYGQLGRSSARPGGRASTAGLWLSLILLALAAVTVPARGQAGAVLEFLQPTNHAVFSTLDEVPIVLRAFASDDVMLTAEVSAGRQLIGVASYCCALCPCFHPQPGDELILQIPVPREAGKPLSRTWQGWTNVPAGIHQLTARAVTQNGAVVDAAPVMITVLDLALRIHMGSDGTAMLVITEGSLVPGTYELEASEDLRNWTRLGPFLPGDVAAFYFDPPTEPPRASRFYRSVLVP